MMNVLCSDEKALKLDGDGHSIVMQIQWMRARSELDVMFLLTIFLNVVNLHVSDIMERTLVWRTISPKTQGSSARQWESSRRLLK